MKVLKFFPILLGLAKISASMLYDLHNGSNTPLLWKETIQLQKNIDQIVLISDITTCDLDFPACIHITTTTFRKGIMKEIKKSMVNANENPIYIIDFIFSKIDVNRMVKTIRGDDAESYILVRTMEFIHIPGFNIFYFIPITGDENAYSVFETCAYCNEGKNELKRINGWSVRKGFDYIIPLAPSFKGSLNRAILTVTTKPFPSVIHCIGWDNLGKPIWGGNIFNMLTMIGKQMDFEIEILPMKSNTDPQKKMATLIAENQADIGAAKLMAIEACHKYVAFSAAYNQHGLIIVTVEPPTGLNMMALLNPFGTSTWVLLFIFILLSGILLWFTEKQRVGKTHLSLLECTWELVKISLWDTTRLRRPCLVMATFITMTFLIANIYLSTLTSFLTNLPYRWKPINNLKEFKESGYKWVGIPHCPTMKALKVDAYMEKKYVSLRKMHPFIHMRTGLEMVLNDSRGLAFLHRDVNIKTVARSYNADTKSKLRFHIAEQPFSVGSTVFFLKKECPYRNEFDYNILKLNEAGISRFLISKIDEQLAKVSGKIVQNEKTTKMGEMAKLIGKKELYGLAILYLVCVILALTINVIEIIYYKVPTMKRGIKAKKKKIGLKVYETRKSMAKLPIGNLKAIITQYRNSEKILHLSIKKTNK